MEAALLTPISLVYLLVLAGGGKSSFGLERPGLSVLLILGGIVTAIPLVLFAAGARRLPLTTLGLLQFTAPTASLLLGVFLYGEPFTWIQGVTFGCIWAACGLYLADAILAPRRAQVSTDAPKVA
jgi:chloramphenicol-sensitive protein RarD